MMFPSLGHGHPQDCLLLSPLHALTHREAFPKKLTVVQEFLQTLQLRIRDLQNHPHVVGGEFATLLESYQLWRHVTEVQRKGNSRRLQHAILRALVLNVNGCGFHLPFPLFRPSFHLPTLSLPRQVTHPHPSSIHRPHKCWQVKVS